MSTALQISSLLWHVDANDVAVVLDVVVVDGVVVVVDAQVSAHWTEEWATTPASQSVTMKLPLLVLRWNCYFGTGEHSTNHYETRWSEVWDCWLVGLWLVTAAAAVAVESCLIVSRTERLMKVLWLSCRLHLNLLNHSH